MPGMTARRPDLYAEIAALRAEGRPGALATVIATRGSTPGRAAMKMLVRDDGSTFGTIGGGSMEEETRKTGLEVMRTERCVTRSFELSLEAVDDSELICGGTVEVFVEPLTVPSCVIFGAGHLGRAIARVAAVAGFRVIVADDRATHCNADRFPDAESCLVGTFPELFKQLTPGLGPASYCVIVTRSHRLDEDCADACLRTDARYVGMIGSRKKVATCHDELRRRGHDDASVGRLRAPVGLELGAETHGEIAVAVVAQLVQERRSA